MQLSATHETEEATMLLAYAVGGATDTTLIPKTYTWEGLCDRLMSPRVGNKDGSYYIRGGKLKANKRADENLLEAELLILDVDSTFDPNTGEISPGGPPLQDVAATLSMMGFTFVAHTSHSAKPEQGFWKYRIVFPAKLKSVEELSDCLDYIIALLHGEGIYIADVVEARRWSQPWFLPRVRTEEDKAHFLAIRNDGLPFDVVAALEWAQERRKADAAIHAARTTNSPPATQASSFTAFNDQFTLDDVRNVLEGAGYRFGYFDRRQQSYRYMRPGSESKTCGVVVFKGSQGHWCTYSHHGNADPLSGRVCDPFDLITALQYGGDRKAAARALIPRQQEPSIVEQIAARQVEGEARPVTSAEPAIVQSTAFLTSEQTKPAASDKPKRKIELIPWGSLKDEPIRWLVKDILPAASFVAIYGKPGSGKSFAALYLAAGVSSGLETFGKETIAGQVVYVAGEGGAGLKRRRDALIKQHDLPDDLPIHFVKAQLNLSTSLEDMEALFAAIREKSVQPSLIIFDTFARIFIGDENSAKDVGACISILGAVQAEFNCCVCIIHHSAKNNDQTMRGSSALLGAVDTELHCERVSADGSKDRIGALTITKQKDGEDMLRFGFKLNLVQLSAINPDATSLALEPINNDTLNKEVVRTAVRNKPDGYQGQAIEALEAAIRDAGETPAIAGEHIPTGVRCVRESLWRNYWKQVTTAEPGAAERNAWRDVKLKLKDKKLIEKWNDWVWLTQ
jgi:hypothetical protein